MTTRDATLSFSLGASLGLDLGSITLLVKSVDKGSQGEKLGVKDGWYVLAVDEKPVGSFDELAEALQQARATGASTSNLRFRTYNAVAVTKDITSFRDSIFTVGVGEDDDESPLEGMLSKQASNMGGSWQSRWFVASGHYLKYYQNEKVSGQRDYCLCAYDLSLCDVEAEAGSKTFKLVVADAAGKKTGRSKVVLKASSGEEASKWVEGLLRLKKKDAPDGDSFFNGDDDAAEDQENDDEMAGLRASFQHLETVHKSNELASGGGGQGVPEINEGDEDENDDYDGEEGTFAGGAAEPRRRSEASAEPMMMVAQPASSAPDLSAPSFSSTSSSTPSSSSSSSSLMSVGELPSGLSRTVPKQDRTKKAVPKELKPKEVRASLSL
jgi:hypothetical protein